MWNPCPEVCPRTHVALPAHLPGKPLVVPAPGRPGQAGQLGGREGERRRPQHLRERAREGCACLCVSVHSWRYSQEKRVSAAAVRRGMF